ncbi:hypothetical protein ACFL5X_01120 [Candidatus Omnitrophota bacterium]
MKPDDFFGINDDFLGFILLTELLFPDDEEGVFECYHCGREIKGNEKVVWIDKKKKIFKCLDCGKELRL